MEPLRHHARDGIAAPVKREGLPNDGRVVAQTLPQRARDYGAVLVPKPLTDERLDAEIDNERHGDRDSVDMVRLAGESQVLAGLAEPSEGIKNPVPLLEHPCVVSPKA